MELKLWEDKIPFYNEQYATPNRMQTYLVDTDKPLPCVVIYAGGGYCIRAVHEGEGYAEFFRKNGIHAVVVDYRVAPNRYPAELADAQQGVRMVRAHAKEWMIDPEKVIVIGSSAGGHLAAMTLLMEDVFDENAKNDSANAFDAHPNGAILCYPVLSVSSEYGHVGSGENLLGERYEAEKDAFNMVLRIHEKTPKCFLWHTSDDDAVNVRNSLLFCEQLRNHKVPFELHVFPHGAHGLGLREPHWGALAVEWIKREF